MLLTLLFISSAVVLAQRDAPVWESHLTKISVYHNSRTSSTVELDYKKEGGHYVHNVHQLYLLVYLKKDEGEIMKLAANKKRLNKKLLLDVLIEKKLVKVLETKATKVQPNNVDNQHDRRNHVYSFEFALKHKTLFETIRTLANFDPDNVVVYGTKKDLHRYEDKFKLLAYVPVNTSPYATKIPMSLRKMYDFTNNMNPQGHYFRQLPYVLYLKKAKEDFLLYIN